MKIKCPNCNGFDTIKHGIRYHQRYLQQLYFCKLCNKNFVINEDFKGMRFKPLNILEAVYLYNKGMKAEEVVNYLHHFKKVDISKSSILAWNKKYKDSLDSYIFELSKIKKGYKPLNNSTLLNKY